MASPKTWNPALVGVILTLGACGPTAPTGIMVDCDSNKQNQYYHWVPPQYVGCNNETEGCYIPIPAENMQHCYEEDEWLLTGDETGGGAGDETGGGELGQATPGWGIDRDTWPTHPASLAHIKAKCTSQCRVAHNDESKKPFVCEPDNWLINGFGKVGLFWNYMPATELEDPGALSCTPWYAKRNRSHIDPARTTIVAGSPWWPSDGTDVVLDCSDFEACSSLFDEPVLSHLVRRNMDELTDDESEADFLATSSEDSSSRLKLEITGGGGPSQASHWVGGRIEYTALECAESTCPFYLGNLTLTNAADTWSLYSELEGSDVEVDNIEVSLRRPVLGVWRPATGEIYLGAQMLDFRVDFDIEFGFDSPTTMTAYGTNSAEIFGEVDGGKVEFRHLTVNNGEFVAEANLEYDALDGVPPVASIALGPDCAAGLQLSDITNTSSDPDDDLDYQLWMVDGIAVPPTYQLTAGVHDLRLEVRDSRYAFDSIERTVTALPQGRK